MLSGADKECIKNFGREISWEIYNYKTYNGKGG
jgi:hypothetical protein